MRSPLRIWRDFWSAVGEGIARFFFGDRVELVLALREEKEKTAELVGALSLVLYEVGGTVTVHRRTLASVSGRFLRFSKENDPETQDITFRCVSPAPDPSRRLAIVTTHRDSIH